MDLAALHIFKTVAETGGITKAAARLHRVQSNVTTRVKQLEESLGTPLFHRHKRRLTLSAEGKLLLAYAERLLRLSSEAQAALRLAAGMASAWVLVHVSAWCLPRLMARRTLAGAMYAGVGVGIVVAGALCGMLMAWSAPSSEAWIVLGAVSLLSTLLIWNVFSPSGSAGRGRETREWSAQWWPLVLCYGAFGFGYIIPATFLPAMARGEVADPALFGWAWPAFGAAAAASTLAVAVLSRHFTDRRLWAMSQLVMALGVGAPLAVHGLAGILIAALCVGGSFMVVTMTGMQEALQVAGPHAARLMAAMTAAFATGQILGPVFASLLIEARGGLSGALLAGCLLLAASAFPLLLQRRNA